MIKSASAKELKQWLEAGEAILVDVREADEWAQSHIKGATHIPLAQVSLDKMPAFAGKKLVMQCKAGGRSRAACGKLTNETSDLSVYNLEGGILSWIQAGYKVST